MHPRHDPLPPDVEHTPPARSQRQRALLHSPRRIAYSPINTAATKQLDAPPPYRPSRRRATVVRAGRRSPPDHVGDLEHVEPHATACREDPPGPWLRHQRIPAGPEIRARRAAQDQHRVDRSRLRCWGDRPRRTKPRRRSPEPMCTSSSKAADQTPNRPPWTPHQSQPATAHELREPDETRRSSARRVARHRPATRRATV